MTREITTAGGQPLPRRVRERLQPTGWRARVGLGPSRRQLVAAVAAFARSHEPLRVEAAGLLDNLRGARDELRRHVEAREELRASLGGPAAAPAAAEPAAADGCRKVRLRDETDAWAWAARTAKWLGEPVEWFHVYPCTVCPAHPLTGKFFHVGHRGTDTKANAEAERERLGPRGKHLKLGGPAARQIDRRQTLAMGRAGLQRAAARDDRVSADENAADLALLHGVVSFAEIAALGGYPSVAAARDAVRTVLLGRGLVESSGSWRERQPADPQPSAE